MRCVLPLFPEHKITLNLFSAVKNAADILSNIKDTQDPAFKYCFLDSRRISGVEQILYAILRALRDSEDGHLRTKTIYSEIVYSLSPNRNITEALKKFGVAKDSTALVCVTINEEADLSTIDGTLEEVTDDNLLRHCQMSDLKEIYKIDPDLNDMTEIKAQIITSIALRGNL